MITSVHIKGYKSIRSQELKLKSINILLGANGVGKSNFISVFSFIKHLYDKNLQSFIGKKGGADSFLHFGKKQTKNIRIEIEFKGYNKFIAELALAQDSLIIERILTKFKSGGNWHTNQYDTNVRETDFRSYVHGQAFYVTGFLNNFRVYHFHDTGDDSPLKGFGQLHDNKFLRKDGSNLAAFLFKLKEKHPLNFRQIELTVKSIAPFFERFDLSPNELSDENNPTIQLEWIEKNGFDQIFNSYHLSDGTLRFIALSTLLLQPDPPETIIIDEPELGLHPVAISKLAGLIKKASKNTQIIISSQSVNLVSEFEPEDIIVADRVDNETKFQSLDESDLSAWLKDYSLGEVWEKRIIGGQPDWK